MRRILACGAVAAVLMTAVSAFAAGDVKAPRSVSWPHGGPFGTYDRAAVQRGFQVYAEVCAACHGLRLIAFRNLTEIGLTDDEAKVIAADYTVEDGPDEEGEMFERDARLSDYFPSPFPNDNAARAANGGALPPDLSLIVKARAGGENYIYSLLTGYGDAPDDVSMGEGMSYNPYFSGGQIAMAAPLFDDLVEYADGTPATVDQMAKDVTSFMAWAAEPTMEVRKRTGIKVILFLLVLTGLLYAVKRKVWSDVH